VPHVQSASYIQNTYGSTNSVTWNSWNANICNNDAVTYTTVGSSNIWVVWNDNVTHGTTISSYSTQSIVTWQNWNETEQQAVAATIHRVQAAHAIQQRLDAVHWRKTAAKQRLARIKAERLLRDFLTQEQKNDLTKYGFFKLYVKKGEETKVYRIRRGQHRNVDLMEELGGKLVPRKSLCLHPSMAVPDADAMLVQKLMLETNEDEFLRIANHMRPVQEAYEANRRAA